MTLSTATWTITGRAAALLGGLEWGTCPSLPGCEYRGVYLRVWESLPKQSCTDRKLVDALMAVMTPPCTMNVSGWS